MSRKEFMERLEKLLWNISESEREEALQYYNDYFDDAGEENEAKVIEELVSPEQVAQKIKAGLSDAASEFSEEGYRDTRFESKDGELSAGQAGGEDSGRRTGRKKDTNFWKILAIVLLCILLLPVILPVGGGILIGVSRSCGWNNSALYRNRRSRLRDSGGRAFCGGNRSRAGICDACRGHCAGRHGLPSDSSGNPAFAGYDLVLRQGTPLDYPGNCRTD